MYCSALYWYKEVDLRSYDGCLCGNEQLVNRCGVHTLCNITFVVFILVEVTFTEMTEAEHTVGGKALPLRLQWKVATLVEWHFGCYTEVAVVEGFYTGVKLNWDCYIADGC